MEGWTNVRTDTRTYGRMDGRTDRRMDRPYFIGPFQPPPGVQQVYVIIIKSITLPQPFFSSLIIPQ